MKSIIAVMISSIIIITIPGNTANSQLDKELLGGGSKFVMLNKTKIDAATTGAIIEERGRRSPGGDGGEGSVGWWLLGYNRLDESKIAVTESTQDKTKRLTKRSPGGDGGLGSCGWWLLGFNRLDESKITVTESTEDKPKRLIRNAPGGDGDKDTIEWWVKDFMPGNNFNTAMAAELTQDNTKRLKRSAPGGDGSMGSNGYWIRNSIPGDVDNTAMVQEPTEDNTNRGRQNGKFNIISGDRSSGSDQFSTSTVETTTKYIDYDKLRWKWIATGGMKRGPCGYLSYIRC